MHQSTTPSLSQTIWARWASTQFVTHPIVRTLLPVTFAYSLSLDNWGDERGCDEGHWHGHTRGLPWVLPEVVGMVQQVHCSWRRLLQRGLESFVSVVSIKVPIQKSLETYLMILIRVVIQQNSISMDDIIYIYIYIYVHTNMSISLQSHWTNDFGKRYEPLIPPPYFKYYYHCSSTRMALKINNSWYAINGYRRRKWTRRHEFKSWTRLIAFHIALIPLGKVWIQLFSLQLWVNSRTD